MSHYSIVRDIDSIIDEFFGVKRANGRTQYGTRTTFLNRKLVRQIGDPLVLLDRLHCKIIENWTGRSYQRKPSAQNWRCIGATHYDDTRRGNEVIVEREIVRAFPEHWINNVPTSSGMCSPSHDKSRNIDLIHLIGKTTLGFYELKWEADTPIFAAIEIILRGLLYLFTRQNSARFGYEAAKMPLLGASVIHLRVLAPAPYYHADDIDLAWLETSLDAAVRRYFTAQIPSLSVDFGFEAFAKGFHWPSTQDALRRAVSNRSAPYAPRTPVERT